MANRAWYKKYQGILNRKGFDLPVTGKDSPAFHDALKAIQAAYGLPQNGMMTEATQAVLDAPAEMPVPRLRPQDQPPPMKLPDRPFTPTPIPVRPPLPESLPHPVSIPFASGPEAPHSIFSPSSDGIRERVDAAVRRMEENRINDLQEMPGSMTWSPEARPAYRDNLMRGDAPYFGAQNIDYREFTHALHGAPPYKGANSPLAIDETYAAPALQEQTYKELRAPNWTEANPGPVPPMFQLPPKPSSPDSVGIPGMNEYGSVGEMMLQAPQDVKDALLRVIGIGIPEPGQPMPSPEQIQAAKIALQKLLEAQ